MNLDALRVKERETLSVPELDFLGEHQTDLSAEEVTKFKLTASADDKNQISDEDKQTLAAIKDGSKKIIDTGSAVVEKDKLDRLNSTVERYRVKEVTDTLNKHVKRGAVKQDQTEFWSKQLLNASDEERKGLETALDALPDNELLAKELGSGEDTAAGSTAREQLNVLAKKKVEAAAKDGKTVLYADALKEVYRENADLKAADRQEMGVK